MYFFDFPLTLSASFGAQFFDYINDYSRILSFDGNIGYVLEEIVTNTLGLSTSVERDKNKKINFYFGTVFNVVKGISLELRAEKNLYHDWHIASNNYDEFMIKGTLTTNL